MKTNIIILILILASFTTFAQTIQQDTILANKYFEKASIFKDSEQYDSAIVYFEKASFLYEKNEMWRKYLISETEHGHCLTKLWELDEAIATLKPAIDIFLVYNDENDTIVADAYFNIGLNNVILSNNDLALEYWQKALLIQKKLLGKNNKKTARTYNAIGNVYAEKGENIEALKFLNKSLEIRKKIFPETHIDITKSYNNIGRVYFNLQYFDISLEYFKKALEISINLQDKENMATYYQNIGIIYSLKGKYDLAFENYTNSINIKKKLDIIDASSISLLLNLGIFYNSINKYDLALKSCYNSLNLCDELYKEKNHDRIAIGYNILGLIYLNKNEYNLALEHFKKSLQIAKEIYGENHELVAKLYFNIGNTYKDKKEFDFALQNHFKALEIRESLFEKDSSFYIATSYVSIGNVYVEQNITNESLKYYLISLEILENHFENSLGLAFLYHSIGVAYAKQSEYDKSLRYFFKALKSKKEILGNKHSYVGHTYNNIGSAYFDKKNYVQSLQYYQKALTSNLLNFNDSTNIASIPIIKNYLSWGELLETLKAKAEIFANQNLPEFENPLNISLLHYQACDILINQVRQEITLKSDKLSLAERASEVYQGAIGVCFKLSDTFEVSDSYRYKEQAFYFSEKDKTRILLDEIAEKNAMKQSGIPDSLIEKEKDLRFYVSFYRNKLAEQLDSTETEKYNEKLFATSREHEALIEQLTQDHSRFAEFKYNQEVPRVADIKSVLEPNTAIRSYTVTDSLIYIFTITENNFEIDTISKNKNFNSTITAIKKLILNVGNYNDYPNLIKHTENMYNQLFPAYAEIPTGIDNLIIIPDDSLSLIPFEVLLTEKYTGDANNFSEYSFLLKKYAIQYSPSISMYYQLQTDTKKTAEYDIVILAPIFNENDSIIVTKSEKLEEIEQKHILRSFDEQGYLDGNGYIRPLIHSETEANNIYKIFKKRISMKRLHRGANEYFVKSDTLSWYRIIHFATHATSNTDKPYLSGVTLSQDTTGGEDGFLHSNEIYSLNLNSELVCLSACETATGKVQNGEGVMDLSRAFFFAGTQNVIATLWKVDDVSTADIMTDFYKKYDNKNMEFVYALQKAKLDMLKSNNYSHPFFWAPFVLIGK